MTRAEMIEKLEKIAMLSDAKRQAVMTKLEENIEACKIIVAKRTCMGIGAIYCGSVSCECKKNAKNKMECPGPLREHGDSLIAGPKYWDCVNSYMSAKRFLSENQEPFMENAEEIRLLKERVAELEKELATPIMVALNRLVDALADERAKNARLENIIRAAIEGKE